MPLLLAANSATALSSPPPGFRRTARLKQSFADTDPYVGISENSTDPNSRRIFCAVNSGQVLALNKKSCLKNTEIG